jgi:hypothetical protein
LDPRESAYIKLLAENIPDLNEEEILYYLGNPQPGIFLQSDREKLVYLILSIGLASEDGEITEIEEESIIDQAKSL